MVEVYEPAREPPRVEQLEVCPNAVGEDPLAGPDQDGRQEQVVLVDEPRPDRLAGELRAADEQVALRGRLQLAHGFRVELALDPRPRARDRLQRPRVDDLLSGPPE